MHITNVRHLNVDVMGTNFPAFVMQAHFDLSRGDMAIGTKDAQGVLPESNTRGKDFKIGDR
jgi:hypothetical protein